MNFNKIFLSLIPALFLQQFLTAQVLCVECFRQNDSISDNVTNMIINGGFEQSTCSSGSYYCPQSSGYTCDIANWTCTGGGTSTYAALYDNSIMAVVQGTYSCYMGNYFCNACSATAGDTSCIAYTSCAASGIPSGYPNNTAAYGGATGVSLSQTVNNLVIGDCYVLEFWTGGEDFFTNRGIFAVDLGYGNILFPCYPTDPSVAFVGSRYVVQFRATAASQTVKFTNWGHICGSCTEVVLDDVKLYPMSQLDSSVTACDSSCLTIIPPPPPPPVICDASTVIIPNIFTPNGDGVNDSLVINSKCEIKLTIYDRWGMKLYSTSGEHVSWDGKYKNSPVTDGVYYYIAEIDGKQRNGFLHIIR
ncbi:MAG: gliding motility-associated C-terminal domain-containing protein [Bacteroidetes bacterium]|nr:gliding motility-associated C-terminal domain-containing protein [Bacteroidota bacterium]